MAESSSAAAASSPASSSRVRVKNYNNMGEIVEVQGGHIVRSTGRKDRHSKVCTAKGPRDRRVRLSAHTAIQFYDVQDRLGYDRPSKAVDWLIKKAKAAIDQLDQLPAWNPIPTTTTTTTTAATANHSDSPPKPASEREENLTHGIRNNATASSSAAVQPFLPPSMDSDSIADTIKSFFPIASGEQQSNASHHHHQQLQFHHSHQQHPNDHHHQQHHHQSQDLRLSLQSLQDTIFHQNNDQSPLFSGTTAAAAGGWSDGGGGFTFNSLQDSSQLLFSTQRGPLQSSNTPSVRANNNWIESQPLSSMADHHNNQISHSIIHHNQGSSSFSGIGMGMGMGFAAGAGFSGGFHHFPARIRGEEEHHGGGGTDKPSSDSSDSRH